MELNNVFMKLRSVPKISYFFS